MQVTPYLSFDGDCSEAMDFYADLMGGEVAMKQTFGEAHGGADPGPFDDRIMHARLQVGDALIMASDAGPMPYSKPQGLSVSIGFDDVDQARKVFDGLAEGGQVSMPFDKTFWARGFGMVTDRFGIPWMVNCD